MLDSTKHFSGLPTALEPLTAIDHWVLWKFEIVDDKTTKVPYAPSGLKAKTNDATTWSRYTEVIAAFHNGGYNGIGFCLLNTSVCAFDLDDCRNPGTGLLHPWAHALMHERAKSYAEITPSGTGLRIIGTGAGPRVLRKQRVDPEMSCESYRNCEKYITISGAQLPGSANQLTDIDAMVDELVQELDALKNRSSEEEDRDSEGNAELPPSLIGLLFIPNAGKGQPHVGYATRSELTFAFITTALRARISGKVIVAACLDPAYRGNAVYEHCNQNRGREYVVKQVKNARKKLKEALNAEIVEINKAHAFVLAGNKGAVLKEEMIEGRTQIRLIQVDGFKGWYANRPVTIGIKTMALGEYWLRHKDRRQYEGIEFAPNGGRSGHYNLWRGFAVEPREGDCSKFLRHIRDNVASGNEVHFNWIVGWFAQIVQQVHIKPGTALCLRGKQGVGKTKVGQVFGSLLGNHYELVSDSRYVTGQFNAHMASIVVLHADEAFWAGDKRAEGKLKDLITGFKHRLEFKGIDPILVNNYVRLFVTGNQDWLVPAGFGERRFAIFDVGEANMQDHDYFAGIDAEMASGGREALFDYLLKFDLSQVNLRKIPQTDALLEQIVESASPEHAWWFYTLQRGELPWGSDGDNTCPKSTLFQRYLRHANLQGVRRKSVEVKIGMFLNKYVGTDLKTEKKEYSVQSRTYQAVATGYVYIFPDLQRCREKFAEVMRQPIKWDRGGTAARWTKEPKTDVDDSM